MNKITISKFFLTSSLILGPLSNKIALNFNCFMDFLTFRFCRNYAKVGNWKLDIHFSVKCLHLANSVIDTSFYLFCLFLLWFELRGINKGRVRSTSNIDLPTPLPLISYHHVGGISASPCIMSFSLQYSRDYFHTLFFSLVFAW